MGLALLPVTRKLRYAKNQQYRTNPAIGQHLAPGVIRRKRQHEQNQRAAYDKMQRSDFSYVSVILISEHRSISLLLLQIAALNALASRIEEDTVKAE